MSFFEQPMCFQRKTANEIRGRIREINQRMLEVPLIQVKATIPSSNFGFPVRSFREPSYSQPEDRQNLPALK
jgi:hypothetical protein